MVKQKTPEIGDLANKIKQEFLEEYERSLAFRVKQLWKERIRGLVRNIFKSNAEEA